MFVEVEIESEEVLGIKDRGKDRKVGILKLRSQEVCIKRYNILIKKRRLVSLSS